MWRGRAVASTPCHPVVMDGALREDSARLTIEALVGHRVWRLVPGAGEPMLASATSGDPWPGPQLEAVCLAGVLLHPRERRVVPDLHASEVCPALGCSCGVYASKIAVAPPTRRVWAAGRVRRWGKVIEGTKGFRAQRARMFDDVEIYLGMGPGALRCTLPPCRAAAMRIWTGSTSYLARCGRHSREGSIGFEGFVARVDSALRRRYGVGAALAAR